MKSREQIEERISYSNNVIEQYRYAVGEKALLYRNQQKEIVDILEWVLSDE